MIPAREANDEGEYILRATVTKPKKQIAFQWHMDLARAKSEAFDNIYSLFKQNIKSCNAKRRRQRRRTVKNNNRSN